MLVWLRKFIGLKGYAEMQFYELFGPYDADYICFYNCVVVLS